jgi:oxalate decarboxylase/phosphoglucose isomerase-like protein (cupin superfamily)
MIFKSLLLLAILQCLYLSTLAQKSQSRLKLRQRFNNKDFKFDLSAMTPIAEQGGTIRTMNIDNFPSLADEGLSFSLYTIEPCGVNLPHVHPRASELLYLISGNFLRTGFVEENGGRTIVNDIKAGQVSSSRLVH